MGIAFLRLEQSKAKWRVKLAHAFERSTSGDKGDRTSRWALFFLPFITVLREGLEAVVFAGGVSLSESGKTIPLAVFVGIVAGVCICESLKGSSSPLMYAQSFERLSQHT